jgi:hypothetical protein
MKLVTLENASKHFSERVLLDSFNRLINEGGLVLRVDIITALLISSLSSVFGVNTAVSRRKPCKSII